jgi:hypothetical protein
MEGHLPYSSVGHEERDAGVRPIVLTGIGLALVLVVVGVIVYVTFHYLTVRSASGLPSNPMAVFDSQIPPAPRIEEHPAIDIQQLHAREEQTLSTYGWVDKSKGVVRIPLQRAMELQMERGFPTRKEAAKK